MAVTRNLVGIVVTVAVAAAAVFIGWRLWDFYTQSPWTQDARVRANVVEVAPDVSGLIRTINVIDNQVVHKGDVLFVIDRERFKIAVEQAEAIVLMRKEALKLAQDDAERDAKLGLTGAVSAAVSERTSALAQEALAELQQAEANLATARINLTRTEVRAPVNGYVTNLTATVGNYATTGQGVLALVDSDSFYVYAYFMETKLPAIRTGAKARVRLMAGGAEIGGTVEGVSRAIADGSAANGLLANVNPAFDWIRLAQRIPVRIKIESVPPGVQLVAGLTCTVVVDQSRAP
ncbi:RND family efflux transporter, MFP subunit [Enhydrobacter aerosaccus]|uniref:RND family efflux transporter, MFP subunit n=1 Tax=Enhydrobacter aerosaccus TaxID=225324 RepID=A0A1T4TC71_9HYPH|nr:HlyD family secretion protein [Enhydrobacter aerosaccus]SKA38115.1 RND family efflux transporter, MFP subunit [Enhydrobacter aerosaccus]